MKRRLPRPVFVMLSVVLLLSFRLGSAAQTEGHANTAETEAMLLHKGVPHVLGKWTGADRPISERVYEILETRNVLLREYKTPSGESVYLSMVLSIGDRRATHPPEVCYLGEGIEIMGKGRVALNMSDAQSHFVMNKLLVQDGYYKELALYWYQAGNMATPSYWQQQMRLVLSKMRGDNIPAVLIRLSTPLGEGDEEADALARIETFGQLLIEFVQPKT